MLLDCGIHPGRSGVDALPFAAQHRVAAAVDAACAERLLDVDLHPHGQIRILDAEGHMFRANTE